MVPNLLAQTPGDGPAGFDAPPHSAAGASPFAQPQLAQAAFEAAMAAAAVRDNAGDRPLWAGPPGVGPAPRSTGPSSTLSGATGMARPGINASQQTPLGGGGA